MITKQQAIQCDEFHFGECKKIKGSRGGERVYVKTVRRNGETKISKTRPEEFSLPVKYGMRDAFRISEREADAYHTVIDCPLNQEEN